MLQKGAIVDKMMLIKDKHGYGSYGKKSADNDLNAKWEIHDTTDNLSKEKPLYFNRHSSESRRPKWTFDSYLFAQLFKTNYVVS